MGVCAVLTFVVRVYMSGMMLAYVEKIDQDKSPQKSPQRGGKLSLRGCTSIEDREAGSSSSEACADALQSSMDGCAQGQDEEENM
jgi:hypothetical protein